LLWLLFWHYIFFRETYKLILAIIRSCSDSCSRLFRQLICFCYVDNRIHNVIKNINKKDCQNIVKWDLVSKFLLSEIQWCNRNLVLILGLWFIDFFKFQTTCMQMWHQHFCWTHIHICSGSLYNLFGSDKCFVLIVCKFCSTVM
jgi:hypothetical protein